MINRRSFHHPLMLSWLTKSINGRFCSAVDNTKAVVWGWGEKKEGIKNNYNTRSRISILIAFM